MPDHREAGGAKLLGTMEPPGDRRLARLRCRVQQGSEQEFAASGLEVADLAAFAAAWRARVTAPAR